MQLFWLSLEVGLAWTNSQFGRMPISIIEFESKFGMDKMLIWLVFKYLRMPMWQDAWNRN